MKKSCWWLRTGLALAMMASVALLLPVVAQAGTNAQIKIEQAKVEFSAQNYQQALALTKDALAEEPNNGEALQYAGLCELVLGLNEEAFGHLQQAAQVLSGDAGVQEDLAWAALSLQRFDDAVAAADKALAIEIGRSRASLYKGQALIGLKRDAEALTALAAVGPGTFQQAAQFYSGVALMNQGRNEEALPYFTKAKDLGPTTALGKKSEAYLNMLGGVAPAKTKDYKARVRLLYQYDTNIVTVNDDDYLPEYIDEKEDGRIVLDGNLAYHFVNTGNARASVGYMGYASWHGQETEMNLQYHKAELSGYYVVPVGGPKLKLGAGADYAYAALDNETYSLTWTMTPYLEIGWTKAMLTGINVTFMDEDFDEDFDLMGSSDLINQRDNSRTHVTLRQHFLLADGKANLMVGYRWGQVWAEGEDYNRLDNSGLAGVQLALPAESLLTLSLRYDDRDYPDNGFDRHDRLTNVSLSYEVPVYQALRAYASVIYTNVDSNMEPLEYERWIYGAGLVADL